MEVSERVVSRGTLPLLALLIGLAGCVDDNVSVYNTPPSVQLIAPLDQEVSADGTAIFQGRVNDGQDDAEELVLSWTSSLIEEPLSTEPADSTGFIQFSYQGLLPGEHLITFSATDSRDASDSESITLFVPTDPPIVTIESPLTGETYLEGESVEFRGTTRTPDGELASMAVVWESDAQGGEINVNPSDGDGLTLFSMVLVPGSHVITLTATDQNGVSGQDLKVIEVSEYPAGMLDQDGEGYCPDGIDLNGDGICDEEELTGPGTQDCDDTDGSVCPGCAEICDANPDNNCDGQIDEDDIDADTDAWSGCMGDCDDGNPLMNPDEIEVCDDFDNDCNGLVDENDQDLDADGYGLCDDDCLDNNPNVNPGADELCDGLDTNCDTYIPPDEVDMDGDGYRLCEGDCLDNDSGINPGAPEICDTLDNNCDGFINEVQAGPYEMWETSASDPGYDLSSMGPQLVFGTGTCSVGGFLRMQPGSGSISGVFSAPNDLYDNFRFDTSLTSNLGAWLAFASSGTGLPPSCQAGQLSWTTVAGRPISVTMDIEGSVYAGSGESGTINFQLDIFQLFGISYHITVQSLVPWTDCSHTYQLSFIIP